MKLQDIKESTSTLKAKQIKEILLLIAKQARLKKREETTGFKEA